MQNRLVARDRRHRRVRKKVRGTAARPRLTVFRSSKHIYAQIVDDTKGGTLAHASTLSKELKGKLDGKNKTDEAKAVGKLLGEIAKKKGITKVAFDRNGFIYHGRIKALADAAREAGLQF